MTKWTLKAAAGRISAPLIILGVLLEGCAGMHKRSLYDRLHIAAAAIRYENGYDKPHGSEKDYFTIHLEALANPRQSVRTFAVMDVSTSTVMAAPYARLADAYIDYGPIEKLEQVLLTAWRRTQLHSRERWQMAQAFLDVRARRYLWAHPKAASALGVKPERPPHKGLTHCGWENLVKPLIAKDDEEFIMVWKDFQDHDRLLVAGKLKPTQWEDDTER